MCISFREKEDTHMKKYKKYDIALKVSLVEEYLNRIKTEKCTKADFAFEKGISDSTFNDWVVKYLKDKDRFINGENDDNEEVITTISSTSTLPTFIELTKQVKEKEIEQKPSNVIKLSD